MSSEEWHAEIQVTDALVAACLREQFPKLMPIKSLECIGEGWDNKVYLVNHLMIFRFPRRKIAVQLIERENAVLTALQTVISLAVPNPIYIGKASDHYSYPFHGYKIVPGQSGEHAHLTEHEREASIAVIAVFLKQLHAINAEQALKLGAKSQVCDRTQAQEYASMLMERVEKIIARDICNINKSVFQDEMNTACDIQLPSENHCLIHGDLYCRHLMFNQGRLTGIIDWGDVGINSPSVDLSVIWSFYPQNCHSMFFDIYGVVDPETWRYARFLGIYSAIMILLYGSDRVDVMLVNEAIESLKRINTNLIHTN